LYPENLRVAESQGRVRVRRDVDPVPAAVRPGYAPPRLPAALARWRQ